MSALQDEALQPPTPFDAFVWTPEVIDESHDRRKLVRLCNRTRSIALERIAIVALEQLGELALEYGDEVNQERQIAAERPARTTTRGA